MADMEKAGSEDETTISAIHRVLLELAELRGQVKTIRDQLRDTMEQNEEYKALEEELKELTTKRLQAKKILEADKDVQTVKTELEELKFKQKDLQEIMSHHLVTHYNETNETQFTDQDGEVHQIVLSAKIGRGQD